MSKRELIYQFMNSDGDVLRPILTVDNNRQGGMELAETVKSLAAGLTDPDVHPGNWRPPMPTGTTQSSCSDGS